MRISESYLSGWYLKETSFSNSGKSFLYNFTITTILTGGNPGMGLMVGGTCALATLISALVKPFFLDKRIHGLDTSFNAKVLSNAVVMTAIHIIFKGFTRPDLVLVALNALMSLGLALNSSNNTVCGDVFYDWRSFLVVVACKEFSRTSVGIEGSRLIRNFARA